MIYIMFYMPLKSLWYFKFQCFKSNGYWNNDLKYIHLLFAGFADVITMCGQKVILLMLSNKVNLFIIMINCQIL